MRVYVAASLDDAHKALQVYDALRARGHEVTYDWATHETRGIVWSDEKRRQVAEAEIRGIISADRVIYIVPGGRGAHCELGAALATRTPVLFVSPEGGPKFSLFYFHPLVKWLVVDEFVPADIVAEMERMEVR